MSRGIININRHKLNYMAETLCWIARRDDKRYFNDYLQSFLYEFGVEVEDREFRGRRKATISFWKRWNKRYDADHKKLT